MTWEKEIKKKIISLVVGLQAYVKNNVSSCSDFGNLHEMN